MQKLKLTLLGIAVILFGISSLLLSGLDLPTYHNGIFELLGLFCPFLGLALSIVGFVRKEDSGK